MKKRMVSLVLFFALVLAMPLSASAAVSRSRAKSIALRHAGYSASQVRFTQARKERDDGRWIYDVEFRVKGSRLEYSYEIAWKNGRILDWDRDYDD